MKAIIIAIALLLPVQLSLSQGNDQTDTPFDRLLTAKSLKCQFSGGNIAAWEAGKMTLEKSDWGDTPTHYDAIDVKNGTARLVGNAGAANNRVIANAVGLHFIEFTATGGISVVTVYSSLDASGKYIAVLSRHMDIFGPVPSQHYGVCELW